MEKEILINRAVIMVLAIAVLLSFSRNSALAVRVQILESSMARTAKKPEAPVAVTTDDGRIIRLVCSALKGRLWGTGANLSCDLPGSLTPAGADKAVRGISSTLDKKSSSGGGGVEVHYADWSKRECLETSAPAHCDPVTKAVRCPGVARLVRVAFTQNGKGLRNRYVCN